MVQCPTKYFLSTGMLTSSNENSITSAMPANQVPVQTFVVIDELQEQAGVCVCSGSLQIARLVVVNDTGGLRGPTAFKVLREHLTAGNMTESYTIQL